MANKQKKQTPKTVKNYRKWRNGHYSLQVGQYVVAAAPETIMTIVNWEDWSAQCGNKYSLGIGFTTAMIGILTTTFAIAKKEKVFKSKLSTYFSTAIIVVIFAIACMFLAKLLTEFGYMLMCVAGGLLGAAACEYVDTTVVEPNTQEYKKLIDENGFNSRLENKKKIKAEREALAKQEAKIKM